MKEPEFLLNAINLTNMFMRISPFTSVKVSITTQKLLYTMLCILLIHFKLILYQISFLITSCTIHQ